MLPGLEVGGTSISLPLAPRDADVIRNACHQAPFGRGDETVVDESVRKTLEIGCEGFGFSNPMWPEFVNALLKEASASLGIPSGARADRYKLLLYDPGSFFKPHKDSEKAPDSTFELTALAWYSDVTHEVKEITSGHRLVLTYNIILDGNPSTKPSAGGVIQQQAALESMLKEAHIRYPKATRLLYSLTHKYSETSLSLHSMKGDDRARVYALQKACASSGYLLLLANITKTQSGFDDEYYSDNDEESHNLSYVATCAGAQVASHKDIDPSFVGSNPYGHNRQADSEDEGEFTGNESMPSAYRYHDSVSQVTLNHDIVAVIVRKDDLSDFLNIKSVSNDNVAMNVAKLVFEIFDGTTGQAPIVPTQLLKQLVAQPKRGMSKTLSEMLPFAIRTGDLDLWNEVFTNAVLDSRRPDPAYGSYYRNPVYPGGASYGLLFTWEKKNDMGRLQVDWNDRLEGDWDKYAGSSAGGLEFFGNQGLTQDVEGIYRRRVDTSDLVPAVESPQPASTIQPYWGVHAASSSQPYWGSRTTLSEYREGQLARYMILVKKCMLHGLLDEAVWVISNCSYSVAEAHKRPVRLEPASAAPGSCNVSYVANTWTELFLADVVHTIQQSDRPPPDSFKPCFERLVGQYVLSEMPPWPQKPVGWAYKRRECYGNIHGHCEACKELNEFLESTTEKTHHFTMVAKQREHIDQRLHEEHLQWQTLEVGAPHTLVVTKLGTEYQADLDKHMANLRNLAKRMEPFHNRCVQAALGPELFHELVQIGRFRRPPGDDSGRLVPLDYGTPNTEPDVLAQGSGNKRPASASSGQPDASKMRLSSVIDLTDD
ncbi:hypothetical protein PG993_011112 [Apiospora rasikravindrae]|uniref:Prolyl 4-hydroxylase alpha subunit Fe(2+) 2OG dioxygenase domain-containing protein n=1 Tax=Apiospora rasikravindrae TaxID=990691 RepID=A0ABR1SDM9_9PEZI